MLQRSDRRFLRLFTALIIAAIITAGMLYGMNKVAATLRLRDPTRYFHIDKVIIPKPEGPAERPQPAQQQPARAPLNFGTEAPKPGRVKADVPAPPPPPVDTAPGQLRPPISPVVPPQKNTSQDAGSGP